MPRRGRPSRSEAESLDIPALFNRFCAEEAKQVPVPGSGRTPERFRTLARIGSSELSLARLIEGHLDALAILQEAGLPPTDNDETYGVWAARSQTSTVRAELRDRRWTLTGTKPFCSGAGFLDRALVTAETSEGYRLFDVDLRQSPRIVEFEAWQAVGMSASDSQTFIFDGLSVSSEAAIGDPGFYLERPGFWFGSAGVSACWFGGACGLLETLVRNGGDSAGGQRLVSIGRAHAKVEAMRALLDTEGAQIDLDQVDSKKQARQRSMVLRQVVHDLCLDVLALSAEAGGARPLCHDVRQARRAADLYVYLAQHHGSADAEHLGRLVLEGSG